MGRFKAVIRLIRERLEALSLRRGIAALCILTAVTMFSFAAPFALNFSYAETAADEPAASQEEGNTETSQNTNQQPEGNQTEANETTEGTAPAEDTTYKNNAKALKELFEDPGNKIGTVTLSADETTIKSVEMDKPLDCLIILSNVNPDMYKKASLKFNVTGEPDLASGKVIVGTEELTFKGLGSEDVSFEGHLDINNASVKLSRPLFNSVTLENDKTYSYKLTWAAGDISDAILAAKIIAPKGNGKKAVLIANMTIEKNGTVTPLNAPAAGSTEGNLEFNASYTIEDSKTLNINIIQDGNAGLLVNSHHDGVLKLTSTGLSFKEVKITSLTQNAGLLVGKVSRSQDGPETGLELTDSYKTGADDDITVTASGSAGGLIGAVDTATITADEDIDLTAVSVNGEKSGGFVGSSKDATCSIVQNKNIKPSLSVGTRNAVLTGEERISSQYAGGLFGVYKETAGKADFPLDSFKLGKVTLAGRDGEGILGGFAGEIALSGGSSVNVTGDKTISSVLNANSKVLSYGGFAGKLSGGNELNTALKIEGIELSAESAGSAVYKSGIAGIVGEDGAPSALVISGINASMKNAETSDVAEGAFGGAAAKLGKGSVIYQAGDLEISTSGNSVNAGGGLVGIAEAESAVRLKGTTDISGVNFNSTGTRIGQLVGVQDSALIYAEGSGSDDGWKYVRKGDVKFDDIGSYGQVYRLHADGLTPGLITMADSGDNPTYRVGFSSKTAYSYSEGAVSLRSKDDLAKLAITIQTRGHFSGYDGIDTGNWKGLLDDKLTVTSDINLAGTGVTGITRDSIGAEETPDAFTGSIDGGNHKITLSIGEAYGKMKSVLGTSQPSSADGCGKVYRHNRLGLFSYGNGSAKDLTIKGSINFEALEAGIAAGAYSACSNSGDKIFTRCSFEPKITYKTNEKLCYVGGVIGMLDGNASNTTTFTGGTTIAPTISITAGKTGIDATGGAIGYVSGSCPAEVISDGAVLSAKVENSSNSYTASLAAGYIGVIMPSDANSSGKRKLEFKNTVMKGHSVSLTAGSATGGLLGYMWADTNVSFTGDAASFGLSVNDTGTNKTLLKAETNTAGGLVYRASGKWTVNNKGVNLGGAEISGVKKSLGLLVCRGTLGEEQIGGTKATPVGLYLELTAPWDDAYPLSSETSGAGYVDISCSQGTFETFDEFVAFSMSGQGSFANNQSGVISLQTAETVNDGKVIMDGSGINTYINRSSYGLNHKTNGWSRYYYNLDKAIDSIDSGNGVIDTPEELLVWSVGIYAGTNIKQCFEVNDTKSTGTTKTTIGSKDDNVVSLNMRGYSYYPVTINNRSIDIKNSEITFYNDKIEVSENTNKNKNTSGSTQHYAMHCGLFRDFNNSSSVEGDYSISCQELTLGGSVGMIGQSSGALISGTIEGFVKLGTNIFSADLGNITLKGLVVNGVNKDTAYAPLLINQSGSYSSINIDSLKYESSNTQEPVASSLIGNVGLVDGNNTPVSTQLSVTFNKVSIPSSDKKTFTKASLLNSFCYEVNNGVGSAVYNFTKADASDSCVTYGKEIDGSTEFKGLQLCYFDSNENVRVGDKVANEADPVFETYLPYVYKEFKADSGFHEIAVNQKFSDIANGCGTYMDPFVISSADQLNSIAKFINNNGSGSGMSITIAKKQETACSRISDSSEDNHITYQKNGGKWIQVEKAGEKWNAVNGGKTISNNTMHRYMQSAYYYVSQNIELTDGFPGIGNTNNPFRGVITGRRGNSGNVSKISITSSSLMGFIPYSYGAVIKDLEIEYQGKDSINTNTIKFEKATDYSPSSFFGGVIGIILGGDNIIDNVKVGINEDNPLKLKFTGGANHKIPTGGYIGVISGGGVIFRNISNEYKGLTDNWLVNMGLSADKDAKNSLYVNPIIGRVISGYAFSEGCDVNNTEKNYSINKITEAESIITDTIGETNAPITTVESAQGLMILSAIIQSGASSGPMNSSTHTGTLPYYGIEEGNTDSYKFGNNKYGKVRNASYNFIGQPASTGASDDFKTSKQDDMHAPGLFDTQGKTAAGALLKLVNTPSSVNMPYLVKNYATPQTGYICAPNASLMRVKLEAGKTYDMRSYGPAYVGLTGRYKSNSVATNVSNAIDRAVPYLICVDGNDKGEGVNSTLSVKMNINEYSDDDFRCAGAGALFSTAYWYYGGNGGSSGLAGNKYKMISGINLTNSEVGIYYYNTKGEPVEDPTGTIGGAGVGGLIGNISCVQQTYPTALISDISVSGVKVYSPFSAGSIVGSVGNKGRSYNDSTHTIGSGTGNPLYYHLIDCTYNEIDVYGSRFAGGFIGWSNPINKTTGNGIEVTKDKVTGRDSKIISDSDNGLSGGITGYQQGKFIVNDPEYKALKSDGSEYYAANKDNLKKAILSNVEVSGNITGGIVGEVENSLLVKNASFKVNNPSADYKGLKGKACIGGVVGRTTSNTVTEGYTFDDISINNVSFTTSGSNIGGVIGHLQNNSTANETLSITNSEVSGCSFSRAEGATTAGATSGGAVGTIADTNVNTVVRNFLSSGNTFVGTSSSGFIGVANGNIEGCNILLKDNELSGCTGAGLLAGTVQSGAKLRIAGISIRIKDGDTVKTLYGSNNSNGASSYIAFADYKNKAAEGLSDEDKAKPVLGTVQTAPYAATSPLSGITVKETSSSDDEYLFGDAIGSVDVNGNPVVTAEDILAESLTEDNATRYKYSKSGAISFSFDQLISTYKKNNEGSLAAETDIPVVRVAGGDTSGIEKYLDIITNGGYSEAKALNDSQDIDAAHVTAEVSVYEWNKDKKAFVRSDSAKPSIVINKVGTNAMSYRATTEYDNGRGRFSLITVTFREAGGEYKVHVPVIVRRILEIDYTATLNYGTVFKTSEYESLGTNAHILESFGNSVTALITYKYNSAFGASTEYGWDSYLAAGGSMGEADKSVSFSTALPKGTMLSLVDCLTGKVYTAVHDGSNSIALSRFKDSSGKAYKNRWMSELMEVEASETDDGRWVKCASNDDPTATARDELGFAYRLAGEGDAASQKYNLTVAKASGKEIQPEESFYLVINVPINNETEKLTANGYIGGSVSCGDVPVSINHTLRPDSKSDNHENTASTYSFLSGYTHSISDESPDKDDSAGNGYTMIPKQREGESGRYIRVKVLDKISFNSSQNYNDKDSLYYKLDINLRQHETSGNETSNYFATGTEGTARMYVMIGNDYYYFESGEWKKSGNKREASVIPWAATAENKGEMSLTLKDARGNALDLAGIRAIAKSSGAEFTIVTEMDLHLSDPAFKQSIMGSLSAGKNEYTQLNYRGVLAVREESLNYSSTSAAVSGKVHYYRAEWGSSVITYSANDIKQLGINCSELDTADGNIETTGTYSLDDVVNADDKIDTADRIVYSLRLYRRTTTGGSYEQVSDPEKYMRVGCMQLGDPSYAVESGDKHYFTWTDTKTGGKFRTADAARRFTVNLPVEVFTDNVEKENHTFANYRLVLTAELYKGDVRIDYPFNSRIPAGSGDSGSLDDHSDYVTYTLTRIATDELINIQAGTGN